MGLLSVCCSIMAEAQPVASFQVNAPAKLCPSAQFTFTNTSTGVQPLSYSWYFGVEDATDTIENPSYAYQDCGVFSVVLTVTDSNGLAAADTQLIVIHCPPVAAFTFTPVSVCDSANVVFTDNSTPGDSIVQWQWNFGDPTSGAADSSSQKNPSHYFNSPGIFPVSLTTITAAGCSASMVDSVIVFHPQSYFAILDSACVNDTVYFIDLSYSQDAVVAWSWNFDDPFSGANVSIKQNPFHIFHEATDYNVRLTITTENGCSNSLKKTIQVHGLPNVSAGPDAVICPADSVQLQASGALAYVWQPSQYVNDPASADPIAFPINTQDFFVTGTDINGCRASDTVNVTVLSAPAANAGSDTTICEGSVAQLQGSGGVSYLWSPSATLDNDTLPQATATPTSTTTYTLTVVDATGCSAQDSVVVSIANVPEVSILGFQDHYCANGAPVTLMAEPAGGSFYGDGVTDTLLFPNQLAIGGPYAVYYAFSNEFGCEAVDTVLFYIHAAPQVSVSATDSVLCLNEDAVSFILVPAGGNISGAGISNDLFDPSIAGAGIHNIYYEIIDTNNCFAYDTMQITVWGLPVINAGNDTVICEGDTIQLQASGGLSYAWSPASSLTDSSDSHPFAYPIATTQYSVTATDMNGCSNQDSILITVFNSLNVDAGMNDTLCEGDTVTLHATGGNDFTWQPAEGLNDATIADPLAFPQQTTMYTVTVNGSSTCPGIDSILITVEEKPQVTAGSDQLMCLGDTVQLTAEGASSYLWEPSVGLNDYQIANPKASPQNSTHYLLTGTALNGCKGTDSILITVLPLPAIYAGTDTAICTGDTLQLAATGGSSYNWSPAGYLSDATINDPLAFPDTNTLFIVMGTDSTGCSNTDSLFVFVLSSASVDAGSDTAICAGDSIQLQASGGLSYHWSPAAGLSDTSIAAPFAHPLVSTTYSVTVNVGSSCSFIDSIHIHVNALPAVDAGTDSSICTGDSLQLQASGAMQYSWSPSSSLNDTSISNPIASPTGTTVYYVTGTDDAGCKNVDTVLVTLLTTPAASAGIDSAICLGDSIMLQASGGISYMWMPDSSLSDATVSNPIAHPDVTTKYSVKVNDGGVCFGYDSVTITVHPLPSADAGADTMVCHGDTILLNASGGVSYSWSPATGLSSSTINNPSAIITGNITYSVTVTDVNHCTNTDSIYFEVVPPLISTIGHDTIICVGSVAQLTAGGGTSYSWSPAEALSDANSATPVATPSQTTLYTVIVSDDLCYEDTLQVLVSLSTPFINAGNDASVVSGSPYQLNATGSNGSFSWSPSTYLSCANCPDPVATPQTSITYTVTVTDSIGCVASDEITLTVGCDAEEIFIPNAFTPDNNGHNDVLFVRSTGLIDINYFRIFDRWGKIIFESGDINNGWDGTYNNQLMPPGVYLYTMKATCGNNEVIEKQGNITLIK